MTANHQMLCLDCGTDTNPTEYYMVRDRIWEQAGMVAKRRYDDHVYLCIGCLERRLGRELLPEDFTGAPVNWLLLESASDRLRSRISGGS